MPLALDAVHELQKRPGTDHLIVTRVNPYIRFVQEGHPPVIIQKGRFYSDGGQPIDREQLPDWVEKRVKGLSPEAKAKVGLKDDLTEDSAPAEKVQNLNRALDAPEKEPPPSVVDAIYMLNPANDSHWTKDGMPSLKVLQSITEKYHSRSEVEELTQGYRRPT